MKKSVKRILCLSLATAMICTGLAACGGGEDSKPDSSTPSHADVNFNGETIKIVTPPGYGLVNTDGKDESLVARDKKLEELGKKYNATFQVKEGRGNYWDIMASSIASGDPAGHIMVTQENFFMEWLKAGAFADLTEPAKKAGVDFKDPRYSQTVRKYTNMNNAQYCFAPAPLNPTGTMWFFNKRIFQENNLGNPYEMVKNGTWTWKTVENIAKKAQKKKADGTVEQWGLSSYMHMDMLSAMCASNGTSIASFDENGKPKLTLNDPAAMKAFETMYDWVVVQKIAKVNDGSQNWDTALREFTNGNIAMMMGTNKLLQYIEESAMEDDFGIVPLPKGPDADKYYTGVSCGQMYFIPKPYEAMADKLLVVINDLYDFGGSTHEKKISEKYISKMRDEESMNNYIDIVTAVDNAQFDAFIMTKIDWDSQPSIHSMLSGILKAERTPGDAMEANKVQFQKCMEDTMGEFKMTGK